MRSMRQLNRRNIENRAIFDVVVGVFVFCRFFGRAFWLRGGQTARKTLQEQWKSSPVPKSDGFKLLVGSNE